IWARLVARRSVALNFRRLYRRFSTALQITRWLIPGWMIVDIVRGGPWTQWVLRKCQGEMLEVPAMVVGIAPALLAWIALWWAEYPADRALREQNVLEELSHGMPVHAPPPLWRMMITL